MFHVDWKMGIRAEARWIEDRQTARRGPDCIVTGGITIIIAVSVTKSTMLGMRMGKEQQQQQSL